MTRWPALTAGARTTSGTVASGQHRVYGVTIHPGAAGTTVQLKDGASGAVLWTGSAPSTAPVAKWFAPGYLLARSEIYVNIVSGTGVSVTVEFCED